MTNLEIEQSGCPFRQLRFAEFYCMRSPWGMESVTGYIMCDVDWESCPDYIAATALTGK